MRYSKRCYTKRMKYKGKESMDEDGYSSGSTYFNGTEDVHSHTVIMTLQLLTKKTQLASFPRNSEEYIPS